MLSIVEACSGLGERVERAVIYTHFYEFRAVIYADVKYREVIYRGIWGIKCCFVQDSLSFLYVCICFSKFEQTSIYLTD